jgi:hypothetical protein
MRERVQPKLQTCLKEKQAQEQADEREEQVTEEGDRIDEVEDIAGQQPSWEK